MSPKLRIHHSYSGLKTENGGIKSYLETLLTYKSKYLDITASSSLPSNSNFEHSVVHVHDQKLLWQLKPGQKAVFTLHNNVFYCPSGTKYLSSQNAPCNRQISYLGCTWGHIVNGCGSRRPNKIVWDFYKAQKGVSTVQNLNLKVVAVSDFVRQELLKVGLMPEQVVTIRNGLNVSNTTCKPMSKKTHQELRLLFVGRIIPSKGLEFLLKALSKNNPNIRLDIAGDGWDRPRLEKMTAKLNLSKRVKWHGWVESKQLSDLYESCFGLVFPSLWHEPAGLVTLEAYAHSRPVIATSVGGIPEFIEHGRTGLLVSNYDENALADAIDLLASDYEKAKNMGLSGYELLVEKFNLEKHFDELTKLYQNVVESID